MPLAPLGFDFEASPNRRLEPCTRAWRHGDISDGTRAALHAVHRAAPRAPVKPPRGAARSASRGAARGAARALGAPLVVPPGTAWAPQQALLGQAAGHRGRGSSARVPDLGGRKGAGGAAKPQPFANRSHPHRQRPSRDTAGGRRCPVASATEAGAWTQAQPRVATPSPSPSVTTETLAASRPLWMLPKKLLRSRLPLALAATQAASAAASLCRYNCLCLDATAKMPQSRHALTLRPPMPGLQMPSVSSLCAAQCNAVRPSLSAEFTSTRYAGGLLEGRLQGSSLRDPKT